MKQCPKCAAENNDSAMYCKNCGESLANVAVQTLPQTEKKYPFFIDPLESSVATFGSNFIQSYLTTGKIENGFAVVTQKRVYFKGKSYSLIGGKWRKLSQERTVDLQDITSTGYTSVRKVGLLVWALVLLLLAVVFFCISCNTDNADITEPGFILFFLAGIVNLITYFVMRLTLFDIAFAGGQISFNVKWYPEAEAKDFQQQIRLAKDQFLADDRKNAIAALASALKK